jgi:hypothetical protein
VLRRTSGPKRYEVTGRLRKLHNEELHGIYSSSAVIRMIKSQKIRWVGHVACAETKNGTPKHRWGIILKCNLKKEDLGV